MDDERIGAFLDRELGEEERAVSREKIEANGGVAIRLRLFRRADDLLRRAVGVRVRVGDHALAQRILNAEPIRPLISRSKSRGLMALAAACVVGIVLGRVVMPSDPYSNFYTLTPEVAAVVDDASSGERYQIGDQQLIVAQTFQVTGEFCRQIRLRDRAGESDVLACRRGARWQLVFAAPVTHQAEGFHVAGADEDMFGSALQALGAPRFVDDAEEATLIENNWIVDAPE